MGFIDRFLKTLMVKLYTSFFIHFRLKADVKVVAVNTIVPLIPKIPLAGTIHSILTKRVLDNVSHKARTLVSTYTVNFNVTIMLHFF